MENETSPDVNNNETVDKKDENKESSPEDQAILDKENNVGNEEVARKGSKEIEGEVEGGQIEIERVEGEHIEAEYLEGKHVEGEHIHDEHSGGEHSEGIQVVGEQIEPEHTESDVKESTVGEGEELIGEELEGEQVGGEEDKEEEKPPIVGEEQVEEEQAYIEEPPPDPSAPFDFSDSKEALKEPFQLQPEQIAEVEQLWELYQNYTPAYTDIDEYITEKELVYMLKCLLLMTYTPEQLQELIAFCVRPPHPEGHINFDQFLKMVTLRQRDFPIEEELRSALQVMDPEKTGLIDREYLREVLSKQGYKMPQKHLENLIKEVDISNDGTIGIEDVIGTMCIDLNKEDLIMLMNSLNPDTSEVPQEEQF